MEVEGSLVVSFTDGSKLLLAGDEKADDYKVAIKTSRETWQVNESAGKAISDCQNRIDARILRQSELTGPLLHSMLNSGGCDLPSLDKSIEQHEHLLFAFCDHWNANMPKKVEYLPIT